MSILSDDDKAKHRKDLAKRRKVTWKKDQIDTAHQAIENWFEENRSKLSSAIDAATAPFVFTRQIKRELVAAWMDQKFNREKS